MQATKSKTPALADIQAPKTAQSEEVISNKEARLKLGDGASAVQVLKGIDLSVDRATSLGIVGPSGSGKSTLLMVLAGLERIDTGSIEVAGTSYAGLSEDQLAAFRGRTVGIVFQSFHLIPNMTALENVAVPLEMAGSANAFDRAREELTSVGLAERLDHYPAQMSGGEQQRVAIARALAPDPAIIIADEPTGNLDETTGAQISELLFDKQRERGTTLVLVTHDRRLAEQCDRQVRVRGGEIVSMQDV